MQHNIGLTAEVKYYQSHNLYLIKKVISFCHWVSAASVSLEESQFCPLHPKTSSLGGKVVFFQKPIIHLVGLVTTS